MDSVLKRFFEPSTVAVIGASREPGKIGNELVKNLLHVGYGGRIFPINPKARKILTLKAYSSVMGVPTAPDLVIVATPARFIPSIIEQCGKKGVKAAVVISGGFSEVGEGGAQLEKELSENAAKAGIRIIGPNCQGVNNPHHNLCATFGGFSRIPGPIAIITQSGTVGAALQCWADREGIGISKCINLGNKADVDEIDLLRYLKDDNDTKVVTLYVEGITDGRTLMKVVDEASIIKPIVFLKGGTTETGSKATLSHTSSLAGKPEIFEAALGQVGGIKANSIRELYNIAKTFSFLPLPKGPGVLIIESTGGAGVLAADMCEKLGLKLPEPDEHAKRKLREVLPSICTFSNPFDLTSAAFDADNFRLVIEENMNDDEFHAFITIFGDPISNAAKEIEKASRKTEKPILVCYLGGGETEIIERTKMHSSGIPVFSSPEAAVISLNALVKYSKYLKKVSERIEADCAHHQREVQV